MSIGNICPLAIRKMSSGDATLTFDAFEVDAVRRAIAFFITDTNPFSEDESKLHTTPYHISSPIGGREQTRRLG
jgi:hypothetical protein